MTCTAPSVPLALGLPVVGMVGAGQLARMTHQAATALGLSLRVLARSPDDGAALVAAGVRLGHPDSLADLRAFAAGIDVLTFDHEGVPPEHLRALAADGVVLRPGPDALRHAQDKLAMRRRLAGLGVPVPRWRAVTTPAELADFAGEVGWPVVAKAPTGGYDGRGVWLLDDIVATAELFSTDRLLLVEERVALRRELAAVVARSPFGQGAAWPVVQTVQQDGICVEVVAPAPDLAGDLAVDAQRLALGLAGELGVVGVLAVELFETSAGLVVNELAMRPHNSAHWTIEGSRTSQFEQHLRAVLDYPLGETTMTAPYVVMANVLGGARADGQVDDTDERLHHVFAADPGVKVHLYGKTARLGRKIGHVTVLGTDLPALRARAAAAAARLGGE